MTGSGTTLPSHAGRGYGNEMVNHISYSRSKREVKSLVCLPTRWISLESPAAETALRLCDCLLPISPRLGLNHLKKSLIYLWLLSERRFFWVCVVEEDVVLSYLTPHVTQVCELFSKT